MSDWPEHGEELARKSLDHLLECSDKNAKGQFSDSALWLVASTLAQVTQGLIPKDAWETIYQVELQLKESLKKK